MEALSSLWDWISGDQAGKPGRTQSLYASLPEDARDAVRTQGLLGLASGLLANSGWSTTRPTLGAGLAAGLQGMQAGERGAMGQYMAGQMARANDLSNKQSQIGMAQQLGTTNALRAAFGTGGPVSLADLNNPEQFQAMLAQLSNPQAGAAGGGVDPAAGPAMPPGGAPPARMGVGPAGGPAGGGAGPGAAMPPAGGQPGPMRDGGAGVPPGPAQGSAAGQGGAPGAFGMSWQQMFLAGRMLMQTGSPQMMARGEKMMSMAVENDPSIVANVSQAREGLVADGQGGFMALPGSKGDPNYQRTMEFAKSSGQSQGQLPAELAKIGATGAQARQTAGYTEGVKASLDPHSYQVPDGNGGYITVNTTRSGYAGQVGEGMPGRREMGEVDKAMLPDLIKGFTLRQEAERGANEALAATGELRHALSGLPTGGAGTTLTNEAAATFQRLGWDLNAFLPPGYATDPTKYAIAAKNFNNLGMALARANFPGGRITNADLEMAIRATPNFWNNPEANKELLDNIEAINRLKVERGTFDRKWLMNNGNRPSLRMEDDWNNHVGKLKGVPDVIKQGFQGYTDAAGQPTGAKAPEIKLPAGAVNFAKGPKGELAYQWRNPDGGLYWGDAQGAPMRW